MDGAEASLRPLQGVRHSDSHFSKFRRPPFSTIALHTRLRRVWRSLRLAHSRLTLRNALKTGILVRVLVGLLIFFVIAFLLSQLLTLRIGILSYRTGKRSLHDHPSNTVSLRIILVPPRKDPSSLLASLARANYSDYPPHSVPLDVWFFSGSRADSFPLPLYPVARLVYGPGHYDRACIDAVREFQWPHGPINLVMRNEPMDWKATWSPSVVNAWEKIVFVDGRKAVEVGRGWASWLKAAGEVESVGGVSAWALDGVRTRDGVARHSWGDLGRAGGGDVMVSDTLLPEVSVLMPQREAWADFLKSYSHLTSSVFRKHETPYVGQASIVHRLLGLEEDPTLTQFAKFLWIRKDRVVYPRPGLRMVRRIPRSTVGLESNLFALRIDRESEYSNFVWQDAQDFKWDIPLRPRSLTWDGSYQSSTSYCHSLLVHRESVRESYDERMKNRLLDRLVSVGGRKRKYLAFTIVTASFVDTAKSWLCNFAGMKIASEVVFGTEGEKVAQELRSFVSSNAELKGNVLIVDIGELLGSHREARDLIQGYGSKSYWRLMLQRTRLISKLLDCGVDVVLFETDQIWLRDPIGPVLDVMDDKGLGDDGRKPDLVGTLNNGDTLAGNFFYLRSSFGMRSMWRQVSVEFSKSYEKALRSSAARKGQYHYIENDQSILNYFISGYGPGRKYKWPPVRLFKMSREDYVDGNWFNDTAILKEGGKPEFYTSERSRKPILINNNFIIGVGNKTQRAKEFGYWFLKENDALCDQRQVMKVLENGS